jgi:mannitol-specific phosphotransferase system IIBC component
VGWIVDMSLLPLVSIIVEPAKILFLNNAINHGVFHTVGRRTGCQSRASIYYLIETNPGPGLGSSWPISLRVKVRRKSQPMVRYHSFFWWYP